MLPLIAIGLGAGGTLLGVRAWAQKRYKELHVAGKAAPSDHSQNPTGWGNAKDKPTFANPLGGESILNPDYGYEYRPNAPPQAKPWAPSKLQLAHNAGVTHVAYPCANISSLLPTVKEHGGSVEPTTGARGPLDPPLDPLHWALVRWPDGCWEIWWLPQGAAWSDVVQFEAKYNFVDPATGQKITVQQENMDHWILQNWAYKTPTPPVMLLPFERYVRYAHGRAEQPYQPAKPGDKGYFPMDYDFNRCSRDVP